MASNIYTINATEWPYLCWIAVKKLLSHSLFDGEFCVPVAPVTRTAGIFTQLIKGAGC